MESSGQATLIMADKRILAYDSVKTFWA